MRNRAKGDRPKLRPRPEAEAMMARAEAGARESNRVIDALKGPGSPLKSWTQFTELPEIIVRLLDRMRDVQTRRFAAGQPIRCDHVSMEHVAFWLAWHPERYLCFNCYVVESRRVRGTPEQFRCDHCGQVTDWCSETTFELPPAVLDTPTRAFGNPATIVIYGTCRRCARIERAGLS
jgi:hypothetical protein